MVAGYAMVVHSVSIAWHAVKYCVIPADDLTTPTFLCFLFQWCCDLVFVFIPSHYDCIMIGNTV